MFILYIKKFFTKNLRSTRSTRSTRSRDILVEPSEIVRENQCYVGESHTPQILQTHHISYTEYKPSEIVRENPCYVGESHTPQILQTHHGPYTEYKPSKIIPENPSEIVRENPCYVNQDLIRVNNKLYEKSYCTTEHIYSEIIYSSVQDSSVQNSSVQNPSVQDSSVQNPSVQDSSVQNPSVQNSSVQNSSVQNSSVQNPSVQNPSVQNSSVQNLSVQNPSVQNLSVQNPSVQNLSVQNPSVQDYMYNKMNDNLSEEKILSKYEPPTPCIDICEILNKEIVYNNEIFNGTITYKFSNGKTHMICDYKDGILNGLIQYFENGKIKKYFTNSIMINTKLYIDSLYITYDTIRDIKISCVCDNGKLNGQYIETDSNGTKVYECLFVNGVQSSLKVKPPRGPLK